MTNNKTKLDLPNCRGFAEVSADCVRSQKRFFPLRLRMVSVISPFHLAHIVERERESAVIYRGGARVIYVPRKQNG